MSDLLLSPSSLMKSAVFSALEGFLANCFNAFTFCILRHSRPLAHVHFFGLLFLIFLLTILHRFSMGFRSGEFAVYCYLRHL